MQSLSIIVPCFNEARNIARFYEAMMGEQWRKKVSKYEMIFIDDGSTDSTIAEIKKLQKIDKNIRLIKFSRNFGKESAMLAGLKSAKNELITLMDCDLQDPPSLLCEMLRIYNESKMGGGNTSNTNVKNTGIKMIVAKRTNRKGEGKIRAFFSEVFYKINNALSPVKIISGVRDFRLMEREVAQSILAMNEYHRFSKAIFEFVGFKKQYLEYEYIPRKSGESKWSFMKLLRYGLGGIISFSITPLRAITIIGIVIFVLSAAWGSYILLKALIFGDPVKGYPSLMVLVSFFGGLQIIMLGVIGEYIGRIYEQSKGRPHYIIEYES